VKAEDGEGMLTSSDLKGLARARLKDAEALLMAGRFDGAAYLCGYAVEVALKGRIVKTLRWKGFAEFDQDFKGLGSFKSHDLEMLLYLSGWEDKMRSTRFLPEWSNVAEWNPESRYERPGSVTPGEAKSMIDAAAKVMRVLL